jgi:hypothetical protein
VLCSFLCTSLHPCSCLFTFSVLAWACLQFVSFLYIASVLNAITNIYAVLRPQLTLWLLTRHVNYKELNKLLSLYCHVVCVTIDGVAFLRRFCQITSDFQLFGYCYNILFRARSSALRPTTNLEDEVPAFISPSDRVVQLHPQTLDSLLVALYDSQGCGASRQG